jgi:hypothetical protein
MLPSSSSHLDLRHRIGKLPMLFLVAELGVHPSLVPTFDLSCKCDNISDVVTIRLDIATLILH